MQRYSALRMLEAIPKDSRIDPSLDVASKAAYGAHADLSFCQSAPSLLSWMVCRILIVKRGWRNA